MCRNMAGFFARVKNFSGEVIVLAVIRAFKGRMRRIHSGINTGGEMLRHYVDRICGRVFHVKTNCYSEAYIARCKKRFWRGDDNTYHIKSVRLPELNEADENLLFSLIFEDTFGSYARIVTSMINMTRKLLIFAGNCSMKACTDS